MSSLTLDAALDELYAVVFVPWAAAYPTAPMLFPDVDVEPPAAGLWAKANALFTDGGQGALLGEQFRQMWERYGILTVQVFLDAGRGMTGPSGVGILAAAQTLVNALEGKRTTSGIWFTNVKPATASRDGKWSQVNVSADFQYQQLK